MTSSRDVEYECEHDYRDIGGGVEKCYKCGRIVDTMDDEEDEA